VVESDVQILLSTILMTHPYHMLYMSVNVGRCLVLPWFSL